MGDSSMANNTQRPGIEVIIEDVDDSPSSPTKSRGRYSVMMRAPVLWQKLTTVLQDNRLVEHEPSSPALNTIRPNDQRLLKKLLNIIFLTIGICLLVAIIVVIIYTSVVSRDDDVDQTKPNATIIDSQTDIREMIKE